MRGILYICTFLSSRPGQGLLGAESGFMRLGTRAVRTRSRRGRERTKSLPLTGRNHGRVGVFENAEANADAVDFNASSRVHAYMAFCWSVQCITLHDVV